MCGDDHYADRPNRSHRQFHEYGHQDHATPDDPDDTCHLVMPEIEIEGPGYPKERQLKQDEPDTADHEKP